MTVHSLSKLFQQGQILVNSEAGVRQDVIKELATEEGLQRIRQVIEQDYRHESLVQSEAFRVQVMSLFTILTNSVVMNSALLEQHISQIYGYMYGVEGRRVVKLFTWILDVLKDLTTETQIFDEYLTVTLQVLSKMIDMKTEAQVNKALHPIANTLNDLVKGRFQQEEASGTKGMLWLIRAER